MILNNLQYFKLAKICTKPIQSIPTTLLKHRFYSSITPVETNASKDATPAKENIIGILPDQLHTKIYAKYPKVKSYNVDQLWDWMYVKGVEDFDKMTSLPNHFRNHLKDNFVLTLPNTIDLKTSTDGTIKRLFEFGTPRETIETVMIPESQRRTLCLSSQIGCSLSCSFCHTGTQKMIRNLKPHEIVGQYMVFAKQFNDIPIKPRKKKNLKNLVFMGQGEPLYNYKNLSQAIKTLTNPKGINFSKHKITVSTSGVVPLIPSIAEDLGVSLALSLHAVTDDVRNELVPLNKQFNIQEVLTACKKFSKLSTPSTQRVTFEYVMLKGVNDSLADAKELIRLVKGIPSHVNLIPFNPWPGSNYECTPINQIKEFSQHLLQNGLKCNIRYSKGLDIMAACGQLRSSDLLKKKFEDLKTSNSNGAVTN